MTVKDLVVIVPIPKSPRYYKNVTASSPVLPTQSIDNIEGVENWISIIKPSSSEVLRRSKTYDTYEIDYNSSMFDILFSPLPSSKDKTNIFIQKR